MELGGVWGNGGEEDQGEATGRSFKLETEKRGGKSTFCFMIACASWVVVVVRLHAYYYYYYMFCALVFVCVSMS